MQHYLRCNAVEQLQHAWREAAFGGPGYAKRHIQEVLELLDHAVETRSDSRGSVQTVRGYIEAARAAVKRSDSLGIVLALVAAVQELEREPGKV